MTLIFLFCSFQVTCAAQLCCDPGLGEAEDASRAMVLRPELSSEYLEKLL